MYTLQVDKHFCCLEITPFPSLSPPSCRSLYFWRWLRQCPQEKALDIRKLILFVFTFSFPTVEQYRWWYSVNASVLRLSESKEVSFTTVYCAYQRCQKWFEIPKLGEVLQNVFWFNKPIDEVILLVVLKWGFWEAIEFIFIFNPRQVIITYFIKQASN